MTEDYSRDHQNQSEGPLGDVVSNAFGLRAAQFRQTMRGREMLTQDVATNKGRQTLWPVAFSKETATATGPNGTTVAFNIVPEADFGTRLIQRDPNSSHVPLCLFEGALFVGTWEPVTSQTLALPRPWLKRSNRELAQLALSHGTDRESFGTEAVMARMGAEMGFVASSSELGGDRLYRIRVFGTARFAGHAVVELRFLDKQGVPLRRTDDSGKRNPRVSPRLVAFRQFTGKPQFEKERRVVGALGGDVVLATCEWRIPRNLARVHACRVTVRPVTPEEALRLAEAVEPIPFIKDPKIGHSAVRRRSGVALGESGLSEHGFLLAVVEKTTLLERMVDHVQRSDEDELSDEKLSDMVHAYVQNLDRGVDNTLLEAGEWNEDRLRYLKRTVWNAFLDEVRRKRRYLNETDLGGDFRFDDSDVVHYRLACESFSGTQAARLAALVSAMDYDTYEQVLAFAQEHLHKLTKPESWHREFGYALLACESTLHELQHNYGPSGEAVKKVRQRLLEGIRNAFENRQRQLMDAK